MHKRNSKGFSHHLLLPILAIFIVASVGVFTIRSSSAQTTAGSAPSCGAGYKLYKQKKNSDGKIVTKVYYKRTAKTATSAYKFTFCSYFKQTYSKKAKANRILLSGPNYKLVNTTETTGTYSKTAKLTLTQKKQCIGVSGITKVYEQKWGQWDYFAHDIPSFSASTKALCSW